MQKTFLIKYEMDTGRDFVRDRAIVRASDEEEAKHKLITWVTSFYTHYVVNEIFEVLEFVGDVCTGKFGYSNLVQAG